MRGCVLENTRNGKRAGVCLLAGGQGAGRPGKRPGKRAGTRKWIPYCASTQQRSAAHKTCSLDPRRLSPHTAPAPSTTLALAPCASERMGRKHARARLCVRLHVPMCVKEHQETKAQTCAYVCVCVCVISLSLPLSPVLSKSRSSSMALPTGRLPPPTSPVSCHAFSLSAAVSSSATRSCKGCTRV